MCIRTCVHVCFFYHPYLLKPNKWAYCRLLFKSQCVRTWVGVVAGGDNMKPGVAHKAAGKSEFL